MRKNTRSTSVRTLIGAGWLIGSRFMTRGIDLASLLILARLLTPADFGVIAIGMTLVQLIEAVMELPVGQVLVRAVDLSQSLISTAFTLGMLRGACLSLTLVALSLPFSHVYHDPRLVGLICFLSLAPALRGIVSPRMVVFARAIDFRREVALEVSSKVGALVASGVTAYLTRSYWAIALGTVLSPVILVVGSYTMAPYRPRWSLSEWPAFASFLGWSTAAQIVTAVNWQSDRPLLGLFVPAATLGSFSVANDVSLLPEQALVKPIYRPLLSGFATIQSDLPRLVSAYLRSASLVLTVGLPLMVSLALLSSPVTRLILGGKWAAAAPMVQWLALTLVIPLFSAPMGPLAVALGRTDIFFRQSLVELSLRIPITLFLTWRFGVPGLIGSRFLTSLINTLTSAYYVKLLTQLRLERQLRVGLRPIIGGSVMILFLLTARPILYNVSGLQLGALLMLVSIGGMILYYATISIFWKISGSPDGAEKTFHNWTKSMWSARCAAARHNANV